MKERIIPGVLTASSACLATWGLTWWLSTEPMQEINVRLALEQAETVTVEPIMIEGSFKTFAGTPSSLPGSWPGFRGPNHDNISPDPSPLTTQWDPTGPPVLWSVNLGEGYAGPAVHNGRIYLLDYDLAERADALRCFSLDNGREIWRRAYKVSIKRNHGMSRTVPAVTDQHVVTIGPRCQVMCSDAKTGAFRWGIDLPAEHGTEVPLWYTGQCPLIDDNTAVIAGCGESLIFGVDCATGEITWKIPNPNGWKMSHASIVPVILHDTRQYLYCAVGGLVAVAADEPDRGRILWQTTAWNHSVIAPSPVAIGRDRVLLTAGYGAGSMMLKINKQGDTFTAETAWQLDRKVFACEQHTPILYRDHFFTVLPADAGEFKKQLVCMSPDGTVTWRSGREHRFGMGPFMIADNKLFVMNDDGHLTVAEASTEAFKPLVSAQVLQGRESWGPMALVNGRLLVRDFTEMRCLDLR